MKTLIIDNYDSFTYNIYQYILEINKSIPIVIKNDEVDVDDVIKMDVDNIIISPGPGDPVNPRDFGICREVIERVEKPILGICLGHQGIAAVFGGKVVHAPEPYHGRISRITCDNSNPIFSGIPVNFNVIRYHSLVVDRNSFPSELEVIAETEDNLIMGLAHRSKPIWGLQFHPESICSEYGKIILENFLNLSISREQSKQITTKTGIESLHEVKIDKETLQFKDVIYEKLKFEGEFHDICSMFYPNQKEVIWLDSNKIMAGFSRFSYFTIGEWNDNQRVEYNLKNKEIKVTDANGEKVIEDEDIFTYLQEKIFNSDIQIRGDDFPFDFCGGYMGYMGYELKGDLGFSNKHDSIYPDAVLLYVDKFIAFDHLNKELYVVALTDAEDKERNETWIRSIVVEVLATKYNDGLEEAMQEKVHKSKEWVLSRNKKTYFSDIKKCKKYIADGESYEICLTNFLKCKSRVRGWDYYQVLREKNPAPYSAYLKFGSLEIASSSPERFMKIDRNNRIDVRPMKGTIKRGRTNAEDEALYQKLRNDEKTFSENLMICDLLRNDLGRVCKGGTVYVSDLMKIESYETVHQMISVINGDIAPKYNSVECFQRVFPGGSMTGAPKMRTVEIIDSLEEEARGIYSGSIGYFSFNGTADFSIVIRTAVIDEMGCSIGVGGAIVSMSDDNEEFEEILLKGRALIDSYDCV